MIFKEEQKTQPIERSEVWEAFKRVKAGGKSPGVDGVTIEAVEGNPRKYLYPVWNRLAMKSQKRINEVFFKLKIHRWTHLTIDKIAEILKAQTRGWINYFGKFRKTEMRNLFRCLNFRLAHWVRNRYRRFWKRPRSYAYNWLVNVSKAYPSLFVHWEHGFLP